MAYKKRLKALAEALVSLADEVAAENQAVVGQAAEALRVAEAVQKRLLPQYKTKPQLGYKKALIPCLEY